jgi:hypothetical protein
VACEAVVGDVDEPGEHGTAASESRYGRNARQAGARDRHCLRQAVRDGGQSALQQVVAHDDSAERVKSR